MERMVYRAYAHYLFGTKQHKPLIRPHMQKRLWSYMGGICNRMGVKAFAINGDEEHVHMLLSVAPHMSAAMTMQNVKSISSKWMNDTFYPENRRFRWQPGYLVHSIDNHDLPKYSSFIQNQKKVHQATSFESEYERLKEKIRKSDIDTKIRIIQKESEPA